MKKVYDNSIKRFVKTACEMAEKATTMDQLERLYNSAEKYEKFLGERMGTGAYSNERYKQMLDLRFDLASINMTVRRQIKRVEKLTA